MIDIHNHVLYGVDDGAQTKEESLKLLLDASQNGTEKLILTPHYCKRDHYTSSPETNLKRMQELAGNGVELYLGNEIFIDPKTDTLLEEGSVLPLAGSRYVLVEFPMGCYRDEYDEWLYNVTVSGYRIIIAHPERYYYVQEDHEFVRRWIEEGYLLQSNGDSLRNKKKRAVIEYLLKNGWLYFIASDAHGGSRTTDLKPAYEDISKHYSTEIADRLFKDNPQAVLEDRYISVMPRAKKRFRLF